MVHGQVAPDEAIECAQILIDAGEILRRPFTDCAGVARERRIDKHQVSLVEQRVLIRHELERRTCCRIRAVGLDAHRRKRSHVQPQCRRARSTVVEKAHRPRTGLDAIERVTDVKHASVRLVVVIANEQVARGRGVLERLAAERHFMMRDDGSLGRNRRLLFVALVFVGFVFVAFVLLGARCGWLRLGCDSPVCGIPARLQAKLAAMECRTTSEPQPQSRRKQSDALLS